MSRGALKRLGWARFELLDLSRTGQAKPEQLIYSKALEDIFASFGTPCELRVARESIEMGFELTLIVMLSWWY